MDRFDLMVIGGGISGLALAWKASLAGRKVLLLEREARVGGCLHSERTKDGYWFELGAHTTYNSYGGFLDLATGAGVTSAMIDRGPARGRFGFLRDEKYRWLTPPKVLFQLNWLEGALHAPRGLFASKAGRSVAEYFSAIAGPKNYSRVIGPFLSAVPSQPADTFPAEGPGSLFKKRPRREEFSRSFGFDGGIQRVCDAAAAVAGVTTLKGAAVRTLTPRDSGLVAVTEDGREFQATQVAVAAPPDVAVRILGESFPVLAAAIAKVKVVFVESVGVVLPREKAWMPECAFLVPAGDSFFSCVTRDPFPDSKFRAFAFHFRPDTTRSERVARMTAVLRVNESDFLHLAEKRLSLPAPEVGHGALVEGIDRALADTKLMVTGNYFEGLAIEDCIQRSYSEWARMS
jgi:protoporphyrinogen/coproporphyrinogen III oxidase